MIHFYMNVCMNICYKIYFFLETIINICTYYDIYIYMTASLKANLLIVLPDKLDFMCKKALT